MSTTSFLRSALALAAAFATTTTFASTPSSATLTVPASTGATVIDHWSGTAPVGNSGAAGQCLGHGVLEDDHVVHVQVPAGTYNAFDATFNFEISWADTAQDLALTVFDAAGNIVNVSDGSDPHEQVIATNLAAGDYTVAVCPFLATAKTLYSGKLTITTQPHVIQPPAQPACGTDPKPAPSLTNSLNLGAPLAPDPDYPAVTKPVAIVTAFDHERFVFTEAVRLHTMQVPALSHPWDRVELVFDNVQPGDPFDRVFGVSVNGVELMRGTTPRTPFILRKDVSKLAALFKPGATITVGLMDGTYLGEQQPSVRFEFYDAEITGARQAKARRVVPIQSFTSLNGNLCRLTSRIDFGAGTPANAQIDLFLSGHSSEEFWYAPTVNGNNEATPRIFHVQVDGKEIGKVIGMPYVYALAGFDGATGDTLHPILWWTLQNALDRLGVHTGVGEIPAYRIVVPSAMLSLFNGVHTVEITQENGPADAGIGRWITSVRAVMDYAKPPAVTSTGLLH
jgi:hypothetical protein